MPDEELKAEYEGQLNGIQDMIMETGDGPSLLAWAVLDSDGSVASATVVSLLKNNLLIMSDGESSAQSLAEAYMWPTSADSWRFDENTSEEAVLIEEADGLSAPTLILLRPVGEYVYVARYECPQDYWQSLYSVFKESAETFASPSARPKKRYSSSSEKP